MNVAGEVPTPATWLLRRPFNDTPAARLAAEKSRVVTGNAGSVATLPAVMPPTSITEIEPGALVAEPALNSPSLTTINFDPSAENVTLSGWKPTSDVPITAPVARLKKPTLPAVVVLAAGTIVATPKRPRGSAPTLVSDNTAPPNSPEKSTVPTAVGADGSAAPKMLTR